MSVRIGGPFLFGQRSFDISLPSGGAFYPPAGNYLVTLGAQTVLQYYNPQQNDWVSYGPPGAQAFPFETDGYNWRLLNLSGTVVGALITNSGFNYTDGIWNAAGVAANPTQTPTTVTFAAPSSGASGQTATGYPIVGGALSSAFTIANAGSAFTVPPLVVIDPPPVGGIQATAHAVLTAGGALSSIVLDQAGAGYLSAPNVYVIPQPASWAAAPAGLINNPGNSNPFLGGASTAGLPANTSGASVTAALTGSGTVTGIVITDPGGGYTGISIPAVTFTGPGTLAAATALMNFALTGVTLASVGLGLDVGAGAAFDTLTGEIVTFNQNNRLLARPAQGLLVISGGTIFSGSITDPGFGFQKVPKVKITQLAGTTVSTPGALTAVVGGVTDTSILQVAVQ